MNGKMTGNESQTVSLPNNPKTFRLLNSPIRVRILKSLLELDEEIRRANESNPGPSNPGPPAPYLSLIAKRAGLNKRTVLVNLDDVEHEGYVKCSWMKHKVRGRLTLVKTYRPRVDLKWIRDLRTD